MKYITLDKYSIKPAFDTLEAAQEQVKDEISKYQSDRFIAQIIEGYKVTVPYSIEVVVADDVQKLIEANKETD